MIAQLRPDIARLVEETVTNLKTLEGQIELVKSDLASLCLQIGHPEAARIAATPLHGALAAPSAFGSPTAFAAPFATSPFPSTTAFAQPTFFPATAFASPLAPSAALASAAPWAFSAYGAPAWGAYGVPTFGAPVGFATPAYPFR